MARKRGRGRPKNITPSTVIPVSLPVPTADLAGKIARSLGLARATWAREAVQAAITKHQRRVERL